MKKINIVFLFLILSLVLNFYLINNLSKINKLEEIAGSPVQSWLLLKQNEKSCFGRKVEESCVFNKGKQKKIVLIGDSHMASLSSAFTDLIEEDVELTIITGCSFYYGLQKKWYAKREDCTKKIDEDIFNYIKIKEDTLFIFHTRLVPDINHDEVVPDLKNNNDQKKYNLRPYIFYYENEETDSIKNPKIIGESYINLHKFLSSKNNKSLIIYPIPETIFNPREKIKIFLDNLINKKIYNTIFMELNYPKKFFDRRYFNTKKILDNIYADKLYKFDPTELFCDKQKCYMWKNNKLLYYDHSHLSYDGAKLIYNSLYPLIIKLLS